MSLLAESFQQMVATQSPQNQYQVVDQMEQYQESGRYTIISSQRNECHRYADKHQAVLRHLADDMYVALLAQVQHHPVVVGTHHITQRIESHHLPIAATVDTAGIEMRPNCIQHCQQCIHPQHVAQDDAEYQ